MNYSVGDRVVMFPNYPGEVIRITQSMPDPIGRTVPIYSVRLDNGTSLTAKDHELVNE